MAKKAVKKKAAAKKAPAKKVAAKKAATKKAAPAKKAQSRAPAAATKTKPVSRASSETESSEPAKASAKSLATVGKAGKPLKLSPFKKKQYQKLLELRDHMVDAMAGVAKDNSLTTDTHDASAFGMHQADAGSDSYDRDFALSLLSQEQDALYEIDEAIDRVRAGKYGICEMSGEEIPEPRLEAIPFARFTVDCQEKVEKQFGRGYSARPTRSLFGLMDAASESVDSE